MLGQDKLTNLLCKPVSDLPKTILLIGEKGCGKHSLINIISTMNAIEIIDITKDLTLDTINDIMIRPIPYIYTIDASIITEKEQNIILKFLEEPPENAIIILTCEYSSYLLDTIINRCAVFNFESYSRDILSTFIKEDMNKDLILELCKTPGQILSMYNNNIDELYDICNKIVDKLDVANYQNTLSISDKINFTDEYDKFDLQMFLRMLLTVIVDKIKEDNDNKYLNMYRITNDYLYRLKDSRLNRKYLFDSFITSMWTSVR